MATIFGLPFQKHWSSRRICPAAWGFMSWWHNKTEIGLFSCFCFFFFQAWIETCLFPHNSWIMEQHNPSSPGPADRCQGSERSGSLAGGRQKPLCASGRREQQQVRSHRAAHLDSPAGSPLAARTDRQRLGGMFLTWGSLPRGGFHPASQTKKSPQLPSVQASFLCCVWLNIYHGSR